jgi:hypothetical protein
MIKGGGKKKVGTTLPDKLPQNKIKIIKTNDDK